jgi:hypothetical protein
METEVETMKINGVEYVRKDSISEDQKAESFEDMDYCIVRTYSAGVFAGYVEKREGKEVTMRHARRIWYWEGAASLSQLATDGTSKPDKCKFPCAVSKIELTEVIEVLSCTEKARQSIEKVPVWRQ